MADQISDALLDEMIKVDPNARVAVETLLTTGVAMVAGEVTVDGYIPIADVVRGTIRSIGYTNAQWGFDADTGGVVVSIQEQSPDIAQGVDTGGAGDQGMMYGYATDETPEFMPMPILYAHKLCRRLSEVRRSGELTYLRPDGKSQVTVEYDDDTPVRISTVVLAAQHGPEVGQEQIRRDMVERVIKPTIPSELRPEPLDVLVNPTGRFVIGGPHGDTGLTGRKIIVDTYGGVGRHGGGCFSGKDPSKVDRSAAYMMRYVAKNIVAAGLARRCELQVAYAIGTPQPVSVSVDAFGTETVDVAKIEQAVREVFDLAPRAIIQKLDLLRPIYRNTAAYGHFGRNEPSFTWERTDAVDALRSAVGA